MNRKPLSAAMPASGKAHIPRRGRAALSNKESRYQSWQCETVDDGWENYDPPPVHTTTVHFDASRSIISRNDSPDLPFNQSINPYRGCAHGCIYCYARPSHAYLGMSPGLDFETQLFVKTAAPVLLSKTLKRRGYQCQPIALGTNTDPYQPLEREHKITRGLLKVLTAHRHPLSIVTKSSLVERDVDILAPLAEQGLVAVYLSITTLDMELARNMEPRAASPPRRLRTVQRLREAGIPCGLMVAPIIPALTDCEMETILAQGAEAGAQSAGYTLLRLPGEVGALFQEWLHAHYPLKAAHVMSLVRNTHAGREDDNRFGTRFRGSGDYASLIRQRFELATRNLGLPKRLPALNTSLFRLNVELGDVATSGDSDNARDAGQQSLLQI